MPGLVLHNPAAGQSAESDRDLAQHFPGAETLQCAADEVADAVHRAVSAGVDYVVVAGGDGTVSAVASVLSGTGVPLVPVPAGRRNHFARDLGITDVEAAARAASHGRRIRIALGRANDRTFVNNASIGAYPDFVTLRDRRDHLPRLLANVAAAWRHLVGGRRHDLRVDGRWERAWIVFVGNGRYGDGPIDLAQRDRLDVPVLDVRVVRARGRLSRLRVLLALMTGRLERSPLVERFTCGRLEVDPRPARVMMAADGETFVAEAPVRFESLPDALTVLAPAPSP